MTVAQRDLFTAAEEARDAALVSAERNAPPEWKDVAFEFVTEYLRTHETMFVEDLWEAGLEKPHEMRAVGAVIMRVARLGMIVKSERRRPRVLGHATEGIVWRSLVFEDGA